MGAQQEALPCCSRISSAPVNSAVPYLVLGVVLLGLLLLAAYAIVNTDAAKLGRQLGWVALGVAITSALVVLVALVASERLGLAVMVGGGLLTALFRGRELWRRYFGGATGGGGGPRSEVATAMLRMRLDHETGAMSGEVRRGSFAGRRLEELDQNELIALWRQCVAEDEQGARLLETYLDRLRPEWRRDAGNGATPGEAMTREQALKILDLEPGADAEQIKEAHHRLMMKLHPDHGGSTFLAAQINRAKDLLLGE
jgi:hypothetical protein